MLQDHIIQGNQKNILFSYLSQLHFSITVTNNTRKTCFTHHKISSHVLSTDDSLTKGHVLSVPETILLEVNILAEKNALCSGTRQPQAGKGTAAVALDENVT